jgi:hypothetical protein
MGEVEFPNLIPGEWDASFKPSRLENRDGKWVEVMVNGAVRSASGVYDFVTKDNVIYVVKVGQTMRRSKHGHIDLSRGQNVDYAGNIRFAGRRQRGHMLWWSNGSGHYLPTPDAAHQAGLPMDLFRREESDQIPQPGIPVGSTWR